MKKLFIIAAATFFTVVVYGQEPTKTKANQPIDINKIGLRPNSRDYEIIRSDNNHRPVIRARKIAMVRHRQALMNRRMMMQRRQQMMRQRMIRQQRIRQQIIQRRQRMSGR